MVVQTTTTVCLSDCQGISEELQSQRLIKYDDGNSNRSLQKPCRKHRRIHLLRTTTSAQSLASHTFNSVPPTPLTFITVSGNLHNESTACPAALKALPIQTILVGLLDSNRAACPDSPSHHVFRRRRSPITRKPNKPLALHKSIRLTLPPLARRRPLLLLLDGKNPSIPPSSLPPSLTTLHQISWSLIWIPLATWFIPRLPTRYRPNIIVLVFERASWL